MKKILFFLLFITIFNIYSETNNTLKILQKEFNLPNNVKVVDIVMGSDNFLGDYSLVTITIGNWIPFESVSFIYNTSTKCAFPRFDFKSTKYNFHYFNFIKDIYNNYISKRNIDLINENIINYLKSFEYIFHSKILINKNDFVIMYQEKYKEISQSDEPEKKFYNEQLTKFENEEFSIKINKLNKTEIEVEYYSYVDYIEHLIYKNFLKIANNGEVIELKKKCFYCSDYIYGLGFLQHYPFY